MDKDIIRFYVPMNDVLNMHVFKTITDLLYNRSYNLLRYFSPVEPLGYTTITHVFHDQVNKLFIVKKSVQICDVSMDQERLDFYLPHY
jgi:hypothetical protein